MDDEELSVDDALEETRHQDVGPTVRPLVNDYDSPAAPADDTGGSSLPPDHPIYDRDYDISELYEGEVT